MKTILKFLSTEIEKVEVQIYIISEIFLSPYLILFSKVLDKRFE